MTTPITDTASGVPASSHPGRGLFRDEDDQLRASVPVDGPGALHVHVHAGSVEVTAAADTDRIEVVVRADNRAAEELLDRVRFAADDRGVDLRVPRRDGGRFGGGTPEFTVQARVPEGAAVTIESASAQVGTDGRLGVVDISVASGDVEVAQAESAAVRSASGDVRVDSCSGSLSVQSASGDIEVGEVGGELRVRTASGDVRLRQVVGDATVESASGDVRLASAGGDVNAKTASGDLAVERIGGAAAKLTTVSGDVEAGVPDGTAVWLDVTTLSGDLSSDFSGSSEPGRAEPADGDATLHLAVSTLSGDIAVRRT